MLLAELLLEFASRTAVAVNFQPLFYSIREEEFQSAFRSISKASINTRSVSLLNFFPRLGLIETGLTPAGPIRQQHWCPFLVSLSDCFCSAAFISVNLLKLEVENSSFLLKRFEKARIELRMKAT